jgi:hypothetical protein
MFFNPQRIYSHLEVFLFTLAIFFPRHVNVFHTIGGHYDELKSFYVFLQRARDRVEDVGYERRRAEAGVN